MKTKIAFVGAGGHARSIIDALDRELYEVVGVYDDNFIEGSFSYLGKISDVVRDAEQGVFDKLFVAIGSNKYRYQILEKLEVLGSDYFVNLIAPTAYVSETAIFEGHNIFVGQFTYIGPKAKLGSNSMVNTGSILEHDSVLGDHSSIATRVVVNGMCTVGSHTTIASGVTIIEGITVGDHILVGAGATVVKNLHEHGTYLGVPAKKR